MSPGLADPHVPALSLAPCRGDVGICTSAELGLQASVLGQVTDPSGTEESWLSPASPGLCLRERCVELLGSALSRYVQHWPECPGTGPGRWEVHLRRPYCRPSTILRSFNSQTTPGRGGYYPVSIQGRNSSGKTVTCPGPLSWAVPGPRLGPRFWLLVGSFALLA